MSGGWAGLTEFRELWFPGPRIRRSELGPAGPAHIEGGRCISSLLGHGLIRLEDGRLHPISRDGGEDVFKSSWVHFSRSTGRDTTVAAPTR